VTAYDPPGRFTIRSNQHQEGKRDVWYVNDYTLTSENGGTRLSERVTFNRSTSPTWGSVPTR
jgi:hypothetical protein